MDSMIFARVWAGLSTPGTCPKAREGCDCCVKLNPNPPPGIAVVVPRPVVPNPGVAVGPNPKEVFGVVAPKVGVVVPNPVVPRVEVVVPGVAREKPVPGAAAVVEAAGVEKANPVVAGVVVFVVVALGEGKENPVVVMPPVPIPATEVPREKPVVEDVAPAGVAPAPKANPPVPAGVVPVVVVGVENEKPPCAGCCCC